MLNIPKFGTYIISYISTQNKILYIIYISLPSEISYHIHIYIPMIGCKKIPFTL